MSRRLNDYVPVHVRVDHFRKDHPQGRILTAIVKDDPLVIRAEIYFTDSEVPNASAHASEEGGMKNRSESAMEKTETAAVGRALAFCGYEIKAGIASSEEMEKVGRPEPTRQEQPESVTAHSHGRLDSDILEALGIIGKSSDELNDWTLKKFKDGRPWFSLSTNQKQQVLMMLRTKIDSAVAETA